MRRRTWQVLGTLGLAVLTALALLPAFARPALADDAITFNFYNNDGTDTYTTITAQPNDYFTYPEKPKRLGYSFSKWSVVNNGEQGYYYFDGQPGTKAKYDAKTISKNISRWSEDGSEYGIRPNTFYANWDIDKYDININLNNDNAHIDSVNQWKKKIYNNPQSPEAEENKNTYYYYDSNKYLAKYTVESDDITLPIPTLPGKVFIGWKLKDSDSEPEKNIVIRKGSTGNKTYIAHWEDAPATIKVTFKANGGSGEDKVEELTGDSKLPGCDFSREGYRFVGWSTESKLGAATRYAGYTDSETGATTGAKISDIGELTGNALDLYAQWVPNRYIITMNPNGGQGEVKTVNIDNSQDARFPINPSYSKKGYTFGGWTIDNSSDKTYAENSPINGQLSDVNITLYAKWNPTKYNVIFDGNGGTISLGSDNTLHRISYDADETIPSVVSKRDGFNIDHWNTAKDNSGISYPITGTFKNLTADGSNVTLYAQWIPNEYNITFDPNGGIGVMDTITGPYRDTYNGSRLVTPAVCLPNNSFQRTGYGFSGWKAEAPYDKKTYQPSDTLFNEGITKKDITFYAQWTPITYQVRFNANDGKGVMEKQNLTYDKETTLTKNAFIRDGYTFAGWTTSADSSKVEYEDGATVSNLASDQDAVANLYAVWTKASDPKHDDEPDTPVTPSTPDEKPAESDNPTAPTKSDDQPAAPSQPSDKNDASSAPEPSKPDTKPAEKPSPTVDTVTVYRLYNPYTGEHLFTTNADEYSNLATLGWKQEGSAWDAPKSGDTPVYRLYNRYADTHLFTTNKAEYEYLASIGWSAEGIAFYDAGDNGTALYRLYNPYSPEGLHLFTTHKAEYDHLATIGWQQEGVALHGLK